MACCAGGTHLLCSAGPCIIVLRNPLSRCTPCVRLPCSRQSATSCQVAALALPASSTSQDSHSQGYAEVSCSGIPAWHLTGAMRQAQTPVELLQLVFGHEEHLNAIHITAATTRLAAFGPASFRQPEAMQLSKDFLELLRTQAHSLDARGVANVLWALGKLASGSGTGGVTVQSAYYRAAAALMPSAAKYSSQFSPQHLSNIMWALAVMDGCVWEQHVLGRLLTAAHAQLPGFTPQGMSNLMWSCAKLGHVPEASWLADFFQHSEQSLQTWECQSLANTLWSLVKLDQAPPATWMSAFYTTTTSSMHRFDGQAIANTIWALAMLGQRPPVGWMAAACKAAERQLLLLSDQQLANLLWGLARMAAVETPAVQANQEAEASSSSSSSGVSGPRVAAGQRYQRQGVRRQGAVPSRLIQQAALQVRQLLGTFTEQGFSNVSWALAKLGFVPDDVWLQEWMAACRPRLGSWSSHALSNCIWAVSAWRKAGRCMEAGLWMEASLAEIARRMAADSSGDETMSVVVVLGAWALHQGRESSTLSPQNRAAGQRQPLPPSLQQTALATPVSPATGPSHRGRLFQAEPQASMSLPLVSAHRHADVTGPGTHNSMFPALSVAAAPAAAAGLVAVRTREAPEQQHTAASAAAEGSVAAGLSPSSSLLAQACCSHMQRHFSHYSPSQLCTCLWALAQVRQAPGAAWLQGTAVPFLDQHCSELSDKELAMYTWAKGQWGLSAWSHASVSGGLSLHSSRSSSLSQASSSSSAGASVSSESTIDAMMQQQRDEGRVQNDTAAGPSGLAAAPGLSLGPKALAAALYEAGCRPWVAKGPDHSQVLHLVQMMAQHAGSMNSRSLATCLWAVARLGYRPGTHWEVCIWQAVNASIPQMGSRELSISFWALASMRCKPTGGHAKAAMRHATMLAESFSCLDACRLLHAAAAWRQPLPEQLWRRLLGSVLTEQQLACLGPRELLALLLHVGRLGLPVGESWVAAACQRCSALLGELTSAQLVCLLEAAALLQASGSRARGPEQQQQLRSSPSISAMDEQRAAEELSSRLEPEAEGRVESGLHEMLPRAGFRQAIEHSSSSDAGELDRLPASTSSSQTAGSRALHATFQAALQQMEVRGLAQATSVSEDARLLRSLVMHRRLSRWLDPVALDDMMTSFFIVSQGRLSGASASQLLHLLQWLAHLNVSPDEAWMLQCAETLAARQLSMSADELSRSLLALVRCGFRPAPQWVRQYMGLVVRRMPYLQERHVCLVSTALAQLDARLHQRWCSQLVTSYGS